ncbi:MAG TPA: triose-phosphate isomerase [Devosiaceae bacterium]|jgi:triosephosphate isomerase
MAGKRTPLIAGNWKMNGLKASLGEIDALGGLFAGGAAPRAAVAICPPATLLASMRDGAASRGIATGGQDCHPDEKGAHTGDVSAAMLKDAGAAFVIVGHSERRADHGETDELVCRKARAGLAAGLVPIICVGETRAEREAGKADEVVAKQLQGSVPDEAASAEIVIAYEPVWAIGTGLTPTNDDIAAMHDGIRKLLVTRFGEAGEPVRILYGGSLKPANAREILAIDNVDGGLVGGASLLANDFHAIISAVP